MRKLFAIAIAVAVLSGCRTKVVRETSDQAPQAPDAGVTKERTNGIKDVDDDNKYPVDP